MTDLNAAQGLRLESTRHASPNRHQLSAGRQDEGRDRMAELTAQLADMRLDLAKRNADVQYLEGELAQVIVDEEPLSSRAASFCACMAGSLQPDSSCTGFPAQPSSCFLTAIRPV